MIGIACIGVEFVAGMLMRVHTMEYRASACVLGPIARREWVHLLVLCAGVLLLLRVLLWRWGLTGRRRLWFLLVGVLIFICMYKVSCMVMKGGGKGLRTL